MSDKKLDLILDELHKEVAVDVTDSRGNARYFNHKLADIEMEVNKLKNR